MFQLKECARYECEENEIKLAIDGTPLIIGDAFSNVIYYYHSAKSLTGVTTPIDLEIEFINGLVEFDQPSGFYTMRLLTGLNILRDYEVEIFYNQQASGGSVELAPFANGSPSTRTVLNNGANKITVSATDELRLYFEHDTGNFRGRLLPFAIKEKKILTLYDSECESPDVNTDYIEFNGKHILFDPSGIYSLIGNQFQNVIPDIERSTGGGFFVPYTDDTLIDGDYLIDVAAGLIKIEMMVIGINCTMEGNGLNIDLDFGYNEFTFVKDGTNIELAIPTGAYIYSLRIYEAVKSYSPKIISKEECDNASVIRWNYCDIKQSLIIPITIIKGINASPNLEYTQVLTGAQKVGNYADSEIYTIESEILNPIELNMARNAFNSGAVLIDGNEYSMYSEGENLSEFNENTGVFSVIVTKNSQIKGKCFNCE
jgi:hypothetical protein